MKKGRIKLILWDFNGVTVIGDHKDTSRYFGKKFHTSWKEVYAILYSKYFNQLALNKINERTAWAKPIEELGWDLDWRTMRKWHLDQQRLRKSVVAYVRQLRARGYRCILFTKNYEPWLAYHEKKFDFTRSFDDIFNTQKYGLPKASKQTIWLVCTRYGVSPSEVMYIDDQEQNLKEPRALGVHTILYTTFKDMRRSISTKLR